jgi:hypothetical protein
MRDMSLSPTDRRHSRGARIFATAIIIFAALAALSGLAAQLANQGAWDADGRVVGLKAAAIR